MKQSLLAKLCLIVGVGTVLLFYIFSWAATHTEEQLSYLTHEHQRELLDYAKKAEQLYLADDMAGLNRWMEFIQRKENTWAVILKAELQPIAGSQLGDYFDYYYGIGRGVDLILHPWLKDPMMELDFVDRQTHFLIQLPERMRPNLFQYLGVAQLAMQIIFPLIVLTAISVLLYRHINSPLRQLQKATRDFSEGRFDVRVGEMMGNRKDELAQLASTFDTMATRISELIASQRQLIADLSHELRTPLARLDIAVETLKESGSEISQAKVARVERESGQLRKLVEDTLSLAWLENERPALPEEDLDLVDLLDVLMEDARFEFPDRRIAADLPNSAPLSRSNHRSLGQALENIIRNAMRHSPPGATVRVSLIALATGYSIAITDQGPGVPDGYLEKIFLPFFRVDAARGSDNQGFGLGLALAKRQLSAIGGNVVASNLVPGGLLMTITLPYGR